MILSTYAAIVGTIALAFQIFAWWRSWQTRVVVTLQRMMLATAGQDPKPVVLFRLVNHSPHPVKVTHVGLAPLHKGGKHIFIPQPLPLAVAGPFEIDARDSAQVYVEPQRLEDVDPGWKTRAQIATSDDRKFESKKVLVAELIADTLPGS